MKVPPINRKADPAATGSASDTNPPKEVLAVSDAKPIPEPPGGNCPPWCITDHHKPVTTADGTPVILPDGRPLTWKGHESAHEWTDAGTGVSVGQMPGGEIQVAVTALPAGTVLLAVDQARTLAAALKADGAVGLADALRKFVVVLEHSPETAVRALASDPEEPDFYGVCPRCNTEWPCEPAMDYGLPELLEQVARIRLERAPAGTESEAPF